MEEHDERAAPVTFGSLLRAHRVAAGLTQAALAARAGVSTRGIQDLERGITHPYRTTTQLLVDALGLAGETRREFERAATPTPRRKRGKASRDPDGEGLAIRTAHRYATVLCLEVGDGQPEAAVQESPMARTLLEREDVRRALAATEDDAPLLVVLDRARREPSWIEELAQAVLAPEAAKAPGENAGNGFRVRRVSIKAPRSAARGGG